MRSFQRKSARSRPSAFTAWPSPSVGSSDKSATFTHLSGTRPSRILMLYFEVIFVGEGVHWVKLKTKSRTARRMQGVQGEAAFEMLSRANELERQGRSIIHLEIGEPDFDTPEPILNAGIEWLKKGATHYSPVPGIYELRTAIARHLNSRHPEQVDPRNVLVTPGAKMMIF